MILLQLHNSFKGGATTHTYTHTHYHSEKNGKSREEKKRKKKNVISGIMEEVTATNEQGDVNFARQPI